MALKFKTFTGGGTLEPRTLKAIEETISGAALQPNGADIAAGQQEITALLSHGADNYIMPNSKAAKAMTWDIMNLPVDLTVIDDGKTKPSKVYMLLTDTDETISTTRRLTETDRGVFNAVCSLYAANDQHIFTVDQIARVRYGIQGRDKPTAQQKGAVTKSMRRLRHVDVNLDCTEEFKRRGLLKNAPDEKVIISDYFIPAKIVFVQTGGRTVEAYWIKDEPPLYEYSRKVKQVITVPAEMKNVKKVSADGKVLTGSNSRLSQREEMSCLIDRILLRIEEMKHTRNNARNYCLRLESYTRDGREHAGLYEIAGYEPPKPLPDNATADEKQKRNKHIAKAKATIRTSITAILDYYKAVQYIAGYEEYYENGKIAGYRIKL